MNDIVLRGARSASPWLTESEVAVAAASAAANAAANAALISPAVDSVRRCKLTPVDPSLTPGWTQVDPRLNPG